jgi:hypothetical protein
MIVASLLGAGPLFETPVAKVEEWPTNNNEVKNL